MTKSSVLSKSADIAIYGVLILVGFITLFPFWMVLVGSVLPFSDLVQGNIILFPRHFDFSNYAYIFSDSSFLRGMGISLFVTVTSTTFHVIVTAMAAYSFTIEDLPGKKLFFTLIIFTMFFDGGLVPRYLLIRNLGLVDNLLVLILPAFSNAFHIVLMKNFFQGIPKEMQEAAKVDGAGYQRIFWTIIMPLSKPVIATIALFIAVWQWNDWFAPSLYLNNKDLWTMALILRDKVVDVDPETLRHSTNDFLLSDGIKFASVTVAVAPIMCVYPFVQKYFVQGTMLGAVKS